MTSHVIPNLCYPQRIWESSMLVAWQGAVWYFFECNRSQFINWIHSSKVDITPEWGDFQNNFGQNRWFWRFPIPSSWILTHATLVFGHSDPYIWPKYTETLLISPMVKIWFQEVHPCNHRLLLLSNDYFCFYPYLEDKVSIPKPQVLAGGAPKDPKAQLGLARGRNAMLISQFFVPCSLLTLELIILPGPKSGKAEEIYSSIRGGMMGWSATHPRQPMACCQISQGDLEKPNFRFFIWVCTDGLQLGTAYFFMATKHGENEKTKQNGFRGSIQWSHVELKELG